ncbi:ribonuclease H-like domain-containing protein [Candidatus Woesearchaeota archaeon]|nr:ribonuclease H-like domain-containing protein [Candidatus Woesearchaeota archaeon]
MIQNSFILLPGIRQRSEQRLWQEVDGWDSFLSASCVRGVSSARKERFDLHLRDAKLHLKEGDSKFFAMQVPFSEQWRLWQTFKEEACFLDIETNGYYSGITVVGISDGVEVHSFVRGFNLDRSLLIKELSKYKLLVTFNGASFDLPVIERFFGFRPSVPHVDLRFVCQKLGIVGGLKSIEKQLCIRRRAEVEGLSGEDAVYLWEQWRSTGDRDHLDRLVWYNEEDVLNLLPLAKKMIPELWAKIRMKV